MKQFKILLYEDSSDWKESFDFNLRPNLGVAGISLSLKHRENGDSIERDLGFVPDLIMVDYDLGAITGTDVINLLEFDNRFNSTSIYFYSGGESLETLRAIAAKFACQVQCFTKDGDEMLEMVIKRATTKKY